MVTWNVGDLAARTSVTRTVTVLVNSTVAAGVTSLTNTATATDDGAGGPDPTPANNTDTDTDTLVAAPDLVVTKTDGVTAASPGDTLTYTLTITNIGNQGATGVTVSDTLPANTTFVSASDGGAFNGGVVTWNIGTVAAGATRDAHRHGRGQQRHSGRRDPDRQHGLGPRTTAATARTPTPANNTASDTDTLNAAPDLVITKTDGLTSVAAGPDGDLRADRHQRRHSGRHRRRRHRHPARVYDLRQCPPEHQPARRRPDPGRRQPGRGRQRHAVRHRA